MTRLSIIKRILIVLPFFMAGSCKKVDKGFLSDNIYYLENPFTVQQGVTTVSSSLVADGSTTPLLTTLLGIRNKLTGESADSAFLKPQVISTYIDAITYLDSTVDKIKAKIKDSAVAPFSINNYGGRLQFTKGSIYIPAGVYTMDVKVNNVKGEKILKDACAITIAPISTEDTILYKAWTTSDAAGTFFPVSGTLGLDITRDPLGPDKIVMKWLDKNGNAFNPAAGELRPRAGRPTFRDWNPYYPEVRTDSTIEYQYITGLPKLPAFPNTVIAGGSSWNDGICYYQVNMNNTDINQNVNTVSTIQYFLTKGTFYVTYHLSNVERKL